MRKIVIFIVVCVSQVLANITCFGTQGYLQPVCYFENDYKLIQTGD